MPTPLLFAVLGAGFALNIFTALCLVGLGRAQAHMHLATIFTVVACMYLDTVLLFAELIGWRSVAGVSTLMGFALGPALFLYVQTMTGRASYFPRRGSTLYALALFIGSGVWASTRLGMTEEVIALWVRDGCLIVWSVGWIVGALFVLRQHSLVILNLFSSIEDKGLNWVRWTVAGAIVLLTIDIVSSVAFLMTSKPVLPNGLEAVLVTVWMAVFGFLALRQHATRSDTLPWVLPASPEARRPDGASGGRWTLDPIRRDRIVTRLAHLMNEERLYRDSGLSLPTLASRLGITTNHLSEAINQGLGLNFFDYVNRFRVQEACVALRTRPEATILELTHEVGFNSRSTFNAAFKKWTGVTPSAFRKTKEDPGAPDPLSSEPRGGKEQHPATTPAPPKS